MYKKYVDSLRINPGNINTIETIPFLPISFFKTHEITTTTFEPEITFESTSKEIILRWYQWFTALSEKVKITTVASI